MINFVNMSPKEEGADDEKKQELKRKRLKVSY